MIVQGKVEKWNWKYKPKHKYYSFKVRPFCSPQSSEPFRSIHSNNLHSRKTAGQTDPVNSGLAQSRHDEIVYEGMRAAP